MKPKGPKEASYGRHSLSSNPPAADRHAAAVADPERLAYSAGIPHPWAVVDPTRIASGDEAMIAPPADGARLPFAGYDRLKTRQVVVGLSGHTQIELEAVESYERSHKARQPVFDKLRYLRGREPLPGYDALGIEQILAAVEKADVGTIKRVRAYERKFRNRPKVLDEVARVQRARREERSGR